MEPTEITTHILKDIRDEIRSTRGELTLMRTELTERIERVEDRLEVVATRQVQTEIRLATELVAVASAVGLVTEELRAIRGDLHRDRELRTQVEDHERRLGALERKTG